MRRHWRLVLLLPILVSLAACLDPTGVSVPNDDEKKDGKQTDGNSAIVLVQDLG
jgi:hypothetical protein